MVAIKFLGLIVTFYFFVIFEAFGQNFYPARYGKRFESDSYQDKTLLENRRIGRSKSQDAWNKKMGFFISGGRFGKRACLENCHDEEQNSGSKEIITSGFQNRQDRSERIRIPIRKNQFMVGSRFGKRMEDQSEVTDTFDDLDIQNLRCILMRGDIYKCLERKELNDDVIESNYSEDFQ